MKYMEKQLDENVQLLELAGQNFGCHISHYFKLKLCVAGGANNIELLMLALDFMAANSEWNFCGIHVNKDA